MPRKRFGRLVVAFTGGDSSEQVQTEKPAEAEAIYEEINRGVENLQFWYLGPCVHQPNAQEALEKKDYPCIEEALRQQDEFWSQFYPADVKKVPRQPIEIRLRPLEEITARLHQAR